MFARPWTSRDRAAGRVEKRARGGTSSRSGSFKSKALPPTTVTPAVMTSPASRLAAAAAAASAVTGGSGRGGGGGGRGRGSIAVRGSGGPSVPTVAGPLKVDSPMLDSAAFEGAPTGGVVGYGESHHHHSPSLSPAGSPLSLGSRGRTGQFGGLALGVDNGSVTTVAVGEGQRLFAAHTEVLAASPVLRAACRGAFGASPGLRSGTSASTSPALSARVFAGGADFGRHGLALPEEDPQVFACVLEYLYKGDYQPRLVAGTSRNTWVLENSSVDLRDTKGGFDSGRGGMVSGPALAGGCSCAACCGGCGGGGINNNNSTSTVCLLSGRAVVGATVLTAGAKALGGPVLRDTAVYCAALRYGLPEMARLALRKQSLLTGIDVGLALRSMRYAYAHTPAEDSRLRAHYLALIIRCRRTFKRSGTMQQEMARGGAMFFDLFVALVTHLDEGIDGRPPLGA